MLGKSPPRRHGRGRPNIKRVCLAVAMSWHSGVCQYRFGIIVLDSRPVLRRGFIRKCQKASGRSKTLTKKANAISYAIVVIPFIALEQQALLMAASTVSR